MLTINVQLEEVTGRHAVTLTAPGIPVPEVLATYDHRLVAKANLYAVSIFNLLQAGGAEVGLYLTAHGKGKAK